MAPIVGDAYFFEPFEGQLQWGEIISRNLEIPVISLVMPNKITARDLEETIELGPLCTTDFKNKLVAYILFIFAFI